MGGDRGVCRVAREGTGPSIIGRARRSRRAPRGAQARARSPTSLSLQSCPAGWRWPLRSVWARNEFR
eukprot:9455272-Pyramimonas_sp.AAC.1